jgi:hypothetical protein
VVGVLIRCGIISRSSIILESVERFIPHKILRKNLDPEYYNKEVKKLKLKVRKACNRRKLRQQY